MEKCTEKVIYKNILAIEHPLKQYFKTRSICLKNVNYTQICNSANTVIVSDEFSLIGDHFSAFNNVKNSTIKISALLINDQDGINDMINMEPLENMAVDIEMVIVHRGAYFD